MSKSVSVSKHQKDFPHSLTVADVGEIMGVGRKTAYQIVNRGDFPKAKVGNRFIIPRDAFFNWFNNEFVNGTD